MNATVLIIDDNKEIRENVTELLELSNYKVYGAPDGKTGLEMALKINPDIILCDIMMPQLDGYGVLRGLSNNPKTTHVPFIYITAKTEKPDLRKGMDLGADDYLIKPFSGDDLLSMISARLKKSQVIKEALKTVWTIWKIFLTIMPI
jgi:DNA-binding response OmpR family regulator